MADAKEQRKRILEAVKELESDIEVLCKKIHALKVAEASMDDEAFEQWLVEHGDLEDGLVHIRLF